MGFLFRSLEAGRQGEVTRALIENEGSLEVLMILYDQSPQPLKRVEQTLASEGVVYEASLGALKEAGLIQSENDHVGLTMLGLDVSSSLPR